MAPLVQTRGFRQHPLYGHGRARELADWLCGNGWPARGFGNPIRTPLNILPAAIEAGIGELGKHGSLICKEMGSLFRGACVATDLPLAVDAATDIGVGDFCPSCRACTSACPPNALTDEKTLLLVLHFYSLRVLVHIDKVVSHQPFSV